MDIADEKRVKNHTGFSQALIIKAPQIKNTIKEENTKKGEKCTINKMTKKSKTPSKRTNTPKKPKDESQEKRKTLIEQIQEIHVKNTELKKELDLKKKKKESIENKMSKMKEEEEYLESARKLVKQFRNKCNYCLGNCCDTRT